MALKKNHCNCMEESDLFRSVKKIEQNLDNLEDQVNIILKRQEELFEILRESNFLMRRSLGLFSNKIRFPLTTEDELKDLHEELQGENKAEIMSNITQIMAGTLSNLERVLEMQLVQTFNYDGTKGKKSLKDFPYFLSALFEATYKDDRPYDDFITELRLVFRKLKNKFQKRDQVKRNKEFEQMEKK